MSRPTLNAGRESFPRQGAGKAGAGSFAAIGAGRPQGEVHQSFDLLLLSADITCARGNGLGRCSAC
jgi:hypothetical protein